MKKVKIDSRRELCVPGDRNATIEYCIHHFLTAAQKAIESHGQFTVALSGGSTPKAVIEGISRPENHSLIDWNRVFVFWSDERAVKPDHPDSNYGMVMKAGLDKLPIPDTHVFRMIAEESIAANAETYQQLIEEITPQLDLVLLGMGDDGHIASLFPGTKGLLDTNNKVIANYIPQKECWRMTFTYPLINSARERVLYVLGDTKATMLHKILIEADPALPATAIGTSASPALWIADAAAAANVASVDSVR